jgi:transposase-like protein
MEGVELLCPRCTSKNIRWSGVVEGGLEIYTCLDCRAQFSSTAAIQSHRV